MHVLVVPSFYPTDLNPIGGQFFRDQVLGLRKYGLEVGVAFANGRSLRRGMSLPALFTHRFQPVAADENGIPTVRILSWNMLGQFTMGGLMNGALMAQAVTHYIAHYGKPDVIHAHQARWAGHGALLASQQHGIPFVITEHESYFAEGKIPERDKPHLRNIYQGATRVIAVSQAMAQAMADVYDPAKMTIIPNMVNTEFFLPPPAPRSADPFVFLCVARLAKVKCIDLLIQAFHQAFAGDPRYALRIVGDGPEYRALTGLTQSLGLSGQVCFTGELRHLGVLAEMQRANAFVLCSDVETFGVVLIEAISCGIPVIATRCGGPEDIVTDDVGLLIECNQAAPLARAMRRMCDDYARYDQATLHRLAAERFGEPAVSARLLAVYQDVSGGSRP